jgi:hypothetical protein
MDAPTRTPFQAACDDVIAGLREQARGAEQAIATLSRMRGLAFGPEPEIRDLACRLHNIAVDLRKKLAGKASFQGMATGFLETREDLNSYSRKEEQPTRQSSTCRC